LEATRRICREFHNTKVLVLTQYSDKEYVFPIIEAGASGFTLFNRFYQPDFDITNLEVKPNIILSNSNDTRLAMRWIAILYSRISTSIAATSGVHSAEDAIKYLMAGANIVMVASTLLQNGIGHLKTIVMTSMHGWKKENLILSMR